MAEKVPCPDCGVPFAVTPKGFVRWHNRRSGKPGHHRNGFYCAGSGKPVSESACDAVNRGAAMRTLADLDEKRAKLMKRLATIDGAMAGVEALLRHLPRLPIRREQ